MDACKQLLQSLESAAEAGKDADTPQAFWKAVVAKVFDPNSVGLAPATVPLSARGFFDGSETGGQPPDLLFFSRVASACHQLWLLCCTDL